MVYDIKSQIIYQPREFGIYGLDSMRVVEGIYAYHYKKNTNLNIEKCFLIKTGRHPNQYELDYQKRLEEGEKAPHGVYDFNWMCYSVQNILIECPTLPPSTKEITKISENTFGHKLDESVIFTIGQLVRTKLYDFKVGYSGINIWQIMGVVASLDCAGVNKNDKSIRLMFNKIYKRNPVHQEISVCTSLVLSNPEEIEHEIEQSISVQNKGVVSASRRAR